MARDEENDEFPANVEAMADRLGLKGKGRAQYIDDHMTGAGYKRVTSYAPGGDDDDDDEDGEDTSFSGRYGGGKKDDAGAKNGRTRGARKPAAGSGRRRGGNTSWYDE